MSDCSEVRQEREERGRESAGDTGWYPLEKSMGLWEGTGLLPRAYFLLSLPLLQLLATGCTLPQPTTAQPLRRLTHWSGVMSWQLTTTPASVRRLWHR